MFVDDVFCPACGAGVQEAETLAGKVKIPVRRHGVIPPMPSHAWAPAASESRAMRGAVVALVVSLTAAGAAAAALYRFW
jgi:hypothetical protein